MDGSSLRLGRKTMEYMEEGSNARIYMSKDMIVQKIVKKDGVGHDSLTQKRIHRLLLSCLEPNGTFFAPALCDEYAIDDEYCMSYVDCSVPVHLSGVDRGTLEEFVRVWRRMWNYGFALFGFELYKQKSGRIAILDFDKTAFRITNGPANSQFHCPIELPHHGDLVTTFFAYPCFPPNFLESLVGGVAGTSEDLYVRLAKLPYHESHAQNRNGRSTVSC